MNIIACGLNEYRLQPTVVQYIYMRGWEYSRQLGKSFIWEKNSSGPKIVCQMSVSVHERKPFATHFLLRHLSKI